MLLDQSAMGPKLPRRRQPSPIGQTEKTAKRAHFEFNQNGAVLFVFRYGTPRNHQLAEWCLQNSRTPRSVRPTTPTSASHFRIRSAFPDNDGTTVLVQFRYTANPTSRQRKSPDPQRQPREREE